ncbi:MAG: sulfotransferase [Desulfobulbaceae bacterium]|nr:sulfotransferase [Desulfobulbaceae bacterium]
MSLRNLKRKKIKSKKNDQQEAQRFFSIAMAHKTDGRLDEAILFFKKTLQFNPEHAEASNNLGNTLHLQGKTHDALPYYQSACDLVPLAPEVLFNYGSALYQEGYINKSIEILTQATRIDASHFKAFASLGVAYQAQNNLDKAFSCLERAIELNPHYQEAHRFLGLVLKDQGNMDGALHKFRSILRDDPQDAFTRYLLSRYTKYTSEDEAEVPFLLSLLDAHDTSNDDAIFLHFSLGKIFDDLKQYEKAFHHYTLANRKKRESLNRISISPGIDLKGIKEVFTPQLFSRYHPVSSSELPVFIIGMPRSGTTLVEQICASHSLVHGAGELKMIRGVVEGLKAQYKKKGYPHCLNSLAPETLDTIANTYLEELKAGCPKNISRITDKMPTNFIELGLIRLIFPRTKIIHCLRDPLDTCLSNFFQNFEEGNECSFDLVELAYYYRKYREVMQFWQTALPGRIFEIRYENLVENVEEESKRLIDFLGLEWQESCLAFFKTKRMVHTSSDWQVRQPIYNKSVRRWKNYEKFLEPLSKGLGEYAGTVAG